MTKTPDYKRINKYYQLNIIKPKQEVDFNYRQFKY